MLLQPQHALSGHDVHFSSHHNLKLFRKSLLTLILPNGMHLQQEYAGLQHSDAAGSLRLFDFQYFGDQVDDFLVDDCDFVLLLEAVPPAQLHAHADLFVYFSLAAQDASSALHTLLYVLPQLLQRLAQRLAALLDQRQHVFEVDFAQELSLQCLYAFGEHVEAETFEVADFAAVFVHGGFVGALSLVGALNYGPGVAKQLGLAELVGGLDSE